MVLFLLVACTPAKPVHALVLTGWDYEWELLSHRVSLLRVELNQDATVDLGLIGGSFTTGEEGTDTPDYRLGWADIGVPGASFTTASADWVIGPAAEGTTTLTAKAPGECGDQVAAFLNGFAIDTDVAQSADYPTDYDPALGYTSNGFGFALGEPALADGELAVDVTASVRWAPQDREDMNAAIPYAQTGVTADVLFVCFSGDLAAGSASGSTDYPWEPPYTEQAPMTGALDLAGSKPDGVVGATGFDLDAAFTNNDGTAAGDYLRGFGVELAGADDGAGSWTGTTTAEITNSSAIEYGDLLASFTADYARVGVKGATTTTGQVEGAHEVGETSVTLE